MTLSVSIGSGSIALTQQAATPVTQQAGAAGGSSGNGQVFATLPAASTAGSAIIVLLAQSTTNDVIVSGASGFTRLTGLSGSLIDLEVWAYINNPGGILSAVFTTTTVNGAWYAHSSEWANVGYAAASVLESSGTASSSAGTTLAPATAAGLTHSDDLAIAFWLQRLASATTVTFTSPGGFARLMDNGSTTNNDHVDAEYAIGPTLGPPLSPILTSTGTTVRAVGAIVALRAASPSVDQTAYLKY